MPAPSPSSPTPTDLKSCVTRRIDALRGLPTTVGVAVRLFGLPKGEGADVGQYARVIAADAGLTARMLSLANSPWFGLRVRITQPQMAISLLGIPAVRTLAINFCLSGLHHELRLTQEDSRRFWEASLCKAVAARQVATQLQENLAEEAYIAGLLQDMALPVMFACARQKMGALLETRICVPAWLREEQSIFNADHGQIGMQVAARLQLPECHRTLIGVHHDLAALESGAGPDAQGLARAVYAASLFPHRLDYWDAEDINTLRNFLASEAGGRIKLEPFLDAVSAECRQQFAYFDGSKVTEVKLLQLVADATNEAAEEAIRMMASVQEMKTYVQSADQLVNRMAQEQSRLAEEVSRDTVTGALTRAAFQRESQRALAQLKRDHLPVAMLYLDADRFKDVNDACGHAAGDEALRQIVAVVRECVRTTDLVGRLGGDEFCVLLPNCPEANVAAIADRIRNGVRGCAVQGCGETRHLSVSVGMVWNAPETIKTLESLVAASDQRMYASKRIAEGTPDAVKAGE